MPAAYSNDLRIRVINAHKGNMAPGAIVGTFGVARTTVYNWLTRYGKTGSVKPTRRKRFGRERIVGNPGRFRAIVDAEPGITQARLAEAYGGISSSTAGRTLARLGYTRKKKLYVRGT